MVNAAKDKFYFIGNNLALDFVNTLIVDDKDEPLELLRSFDDLIGWVSASGIMNADPTSAEKRKLNSEQRAILFERALHLRSELKKMAKAISEGRRVPTSAVEAINEVFSEVEGHFELSTTPTGYATNFRIDDRDPALIFMPIAESAAKLLGDGDLSLVRKCQRSACVLYFYDNSKRHGRRWCSMAACGNRAKVAAHYERTRTR
jgi:predicted RNA-binding Zn ribbon-like protein